MEYPNIVFAKVMQGDPITGQHCEMTIEIRKNAKFDKIIFNIF